MAYLFMDSFDGYALADLPAKYSSQGGESGPATGGETLLNSGRRGTNGLHGAISAGIATRAARFLQKSLPASGDTFIFGSSYNYTAAGSVFFAGGPILGTNASFGTPQLVSVMYIGQPHLWFWLLSDGTIQVLRGIDTTGNCITIACSSLPVPQATTVFLEYKVVIHNTTGYIEVRMDDEVILTFNGNTRHTQMTQNTWNAFRIGGASMANANFDYIYDDLYCFDGSGSDCNDFAGDHQIDAQVPNANGTNNGSAPSTGTDRFEMVNDSTPNGDTDRNTLSASGQKDTFGFANLPNGSANVKAVQLNMYAKKETSGPNNLKGIWRLGGTDYQSAQERGVPSTYSDRHVGWSRRPSDNGAITVADVDGEEFGYEKTA